MSIQGIGGTPGTSPIPDQKDEQLRKAARDLEGVFVMELLKAMRETVPQDGLTSGGMGEEMFTGMLDEHLAPQMGDGWSGGIGEALYRQLRGALAGQTYEGEGQS